MWLREANKSCCRSQPGAGSSRLRAFGRACRYIRVHQTPAMNARPARGGCSPCQDHTIFDSHQRTLSLMHAFAPLSREMTRSHIYRVGYRDVRWATIKFEGPSREPFEHENVFYRV
jgi:hypothetical protein